ncbi:MAG: hypothetical protein AABY15_01910 [Nanoarchaeota archaeon]
MNELKDIAVDIKNVIHQRQKEMELSFVEDTHTYYIRGLDGEITSSLPSVSKVLKAFYHPFVPENTKAFKDCLGDPVREKALLKEWSDKGDYSTNMGSRVHYILEQELVERYGNYKSVRKPIFECDQVQIETGDAMIKAGKEFIDLMHKRGAVLIDTETVLGSAELGFTGQPDKLWLMMGKDKLPGLVVTDWKSNQPKNFEVHSFTKLMKPPFEKYWDTALSHYYIQLPLYAKLVLKMLEGTKYGNIKFLGGVVVLLRKEEFFEEHKIPQDVVNTVLKMNVKKYLK